jgi:hypothetical protein
MRNLLSWVAEESASIPFVLAKEIFGKGMGVGAVIGETGMWFTGLGWEGGGHREMSPGSRVGVVAGVFEESVTVFN